MDVDIFLDHDQAPSELRRAVTGFKSGFGEVRVAGVRSHRVVMPVQTVELRKSGYDRVRDEAQWLYFDPRGARQFAAMLMEMADHAEAADGVPSTYEEVRGNLDAPLVVGEFNVQAEDYEVDDDETEPVVHMLLKAMEPAVAGVPEPPINDFHFILPEELADALAEELFQVQVTEPDGSFVRDFRVEPQIFADDDGSHRLPVLNIHLESLPNSQLETVEDALSPDEDGSARVEQTFTMTLSAADRLGDWLQRAVNALGAVARQSGQEAPAVDPTPDGVRSFRVRQGYVGQDDEEPSPVVYLTIQSGPLSQAHLEDPFVKRVASFALPREDAARLGEDLVAAGGEDDRDRFS